MWHTIMIVILFLAILISLGSGLYFLLMDRNSSARLVTSLTIRIVLTLLLMLVVIIAWLQGDISSHAPWLYR
ncbi:DUF2909 domain-containing protein [Endozoicomonas sp. Mp262]|uniref:DUF2909 domain-containing protein n=1 Tax=Endozoicomonas sp. Mp262 TaxID=2919499 RepID=UPI0021DB7093